MDSYRWGISMAHLAGGSLLEGLGLLGLHLNSLWNWGGPLEEGSRRVWCLVLQWVFLMHWDGNTGSLSGIANRLFFPPPPRQNIHLSFISLPHIIQPRLA